MYHFILNPASRSGIAEKIWFQTLEPYLNQNHIDYLVHFSQASGDITRIVKEIMTDEPEMSKIIVLGGDGTLNEALQGVTDFSKVMFGLIPIGSSNDLTRDTPLKKDPIAAIEHIRTIVTPTAIDYGTVTYDDGFTQNFLVSSGIGFDAAVCEEVNRSALKKFLNKLHLGKLVYLGVALKQIIRSLKTNATLVLDGEKSIAIRNLFFLATMNHKHEGGGFMFAPDAVYSDGLLDLCCVTCQNKLILLTALPAAYKGKHFKREGIDPYKCSSFTLETETPLWVHVDGEVARQANKIQVTCHKQKLLFLL